MFLALIGLSMVGAKISSPITGVNIDATNRSALKTRAVIKTPKLIIGKKVRAIVPVIRSGTYNVVNSFRFLDSLPDK
ncbi:Uncharacterised protein [Legionella hackeliae]|nr:hypothetical protein Lhac_3168 [Legionella hackeliae]STX47502.1 Uncharacterised protein [Legionella hackeliae]